MLYGIKGSFNFPDLPTEQLVDVILFYSKKLLKPYKFDKGRPIFTASALELISLKIIDELNQVEEELKTEHIKKKIKDYPFIFTKYKSYIEENQTHLSNRIFAEFLDDEKNQLIFTLNLFGYKHYALILDSIFREHVFEFKFISYVSTYFYYESIRFDKKIRNRNNKETIILDSPLSEDLSMKELIIQPNQDTLVKIGIEDIFSNEKLANSFQVLTPNQRYVLLLYYVEGFKDLEIALKMGVTPQAVSKTKKNAIQKIRKIMKGE